MVLRIVEPTMPLNFIAYFASFIGLVIGLVGIVTHVQSRK
jgi:type III secretory pathway component EscS